MASGSKYGRSLTDASDALYDFSCTPCSDDGKNSEGLYQCVVCQMFYCQRCVKTHNKFTKNHNVLDKSSAKFGQGQKQKAAPSSSELPTEVCEEHHGKAISMFCRQHDAVCCTVCIQAKHRSCVDVEYIPDIAKGLLQRHGKEKTKSSLEKVKDDLQNLKSKMQNELETLNQERDDIIDAIQLFKRSVIARVEELEKQSLDDVQTKHKAISGEINACAEKIDHMLKDVELRLDKLKHPKNDAQAFIDFKYAEQTSSLGNECTETSTLRNVQHMAFEFNTGIETCLSWMTSLGILKDNTDKQARVNIIPYLDDTNSDRIIQFMGLLQEKLRTMFMIESHYTRPEEIVEDRHTILVLEYGFDTEDQAVKNIARKYDDVMILLVLKKRKEPVLCPYHGRKFKAKFYVQYVNDSNDISASFQYDENQLVYDAMANIIKNDKLVN